MISSGRSGTDSPSCHQLILELIPGGANKDLSADQAKVLLAKVRPRDAAGKARRQVVAELIADLERVYQRKRGRRQGTQGAGRRHLQSSLLRRPWLLVWPECQS
jgi:hypothetical protein